MKINTFEHLKSCQKHVALHLYCSTTASELRHRFPKIFWRKIHWNIKERLLLLNVPSHSCRKGHILLGKYHRKRPSHENILPAIHMSISVFCYSCPLNFSQLAGNDYICSLVKAILALKKISFSQYKNTILNRLF